MVESSSLLPRDRAFLIRYESDVDLDGGAVRGRIEHVESGRGARFASQQELDAFVGQVLRDATQAARGGMGIPKDGDG